jgi:ketosteroid isomerase-like protein
MSTSDDAEAVARRLVAEYNRGTADWVEACHAENTRWIEFPFLGTSGRQGGRAALRQAAEDGVAAFPDHHMEIISIIASGNRAALEVQWTATAAQPLSWAAEGATVYLRGVLLLTVANGKIVEEIDYVVPVPVGAAPSDQT